MKNIPTRKCLATNEVFPKKDLFRVVRTPSGEVILDMTGKANGRGAYISKTIEAIDKAKKTKCLEKSLEVSIDDSLYERMKLFLKMK